jgi:hypothetical protein
MDKLIKLLNERLEYVKNNYYESFRKVVRLSKELEEEKKLMDNWGVSWKKLLVTLGTLRDQDIINYNDLTTEDHLLMDNFITEYQVRDE